MINQILLGVLGVSAVLFSQSPEESRRSIAPILGLMAQPFWFYTTFTSGQWGIFLLSFFYTYAWWKGFQLYWGDRVSRILGL